MGSIGFFNSVMSWGGGEKWHYEAALYFAEKGFKVCFYTRYNSELYKKLILIKSISVRIVDVKGVSFLNPYKIHKLKKSFSDAQIDTLLINLPNDVKLAAHAAKLAGVRRIIYRRGSAIPIKNSLLNRFTFKYWLTDILANSQATKKTILQHNSNLFPKENIKVIYNPIDVQGFVNQSFTPIYSAQDDELVIGNLGRLEYEKNQRFLIRLSEQLQKRGVRHKIIIGGSGRLEQELREEAQRHNVSDNILFAGFITNVKDLLSSCDVFILPSLWEGFGYVLAEASLCRKPIIAFNLSSIPEVVINGESGFLIENNVEECLEKVLTLKEDPALRKRMGDAGFNHIAATFDRDKLMEEVEEYLTYTNKR